MNREIKLDLTGIPNYKVNTKEERFERANIQRDFAINKIKTQNQWLDDVKTIKDFFGYYSTKLDIVFGDLVIIYYKHVIFIDLKVAEKYADLNYYTTINFNSILKFGDINQFGNNFLDPNIEYDWYYLNVKSNDTFGWVHHKDMKTSFYENPKCLYPTKKDRTINKNLDKYLYKLNLYDSTYVENGVSEYDYMPSKFYTKYVIPNLYLPYMEWNEAIENFCEEKYNMKYQIAI